MPSKKVLKEKLYFFVDEAGDATFYNKYGRLIVGEEGCSEILLLGFIKCENPEKLRRSVLDLQRGEDRYFKFIEDKVTYLCDVYDTDKYPKNFYSRGNKFDITKMSPL